MEEISYLYGAPWLAGLPNNPQDSFVAPLGQVELYFKFLQGMPEDMKSLIEQAGKEYIAIAAGMEKLGIKFYIAHLSGIRHLDGLAAIFEKGFGSGAVPLPKEMAHELVFYPRDMFGYLRTQNAILVNSQIRKFVKIPEKSGCGIYPHTQNGYLKSHEARNGQSHIRKGVGVYFSPYGEGGSALYAKNILIVGKRYIDDKIEFRSDQALDTLKKKGLQIIVLPSPVVRTFSRKSLGDKAGIDEHIDRSMNLLEAADGSLHLVVDPNIHLAAGKDGKNQFSLICPKEALEIIKAACEPFGIKAHYPARINIPCSLGFMQFANKKVLMTSGDDAVYSVVEKIVGRENVAKTYVPAIATAVFGRAGIRCTINEFPELMREIFPPLA